MHSKQATQVANEKLTDGISQNAKVLRQKIVKEFGRQLTAAIPSLKKGNGRFWVVPLNKHAYFYVSLVFPKYLYGDSRFEVVYHVEKISDHKPVEAMFGYDQQVVRFPFRLHKRLFEFPGVRWQKPKVGYVYWKLLMQSSKIHYYTQQQAEYDINYLLPFAADEIQAAYKAAVVRYGAERNEGNHE